MHDQILSYTHPQLLRVIGPLQPRLHQEGFQVVFRFRNGYGASVVQHKSSYGGDQGKYELAVARWESDQDEHWSICYSTPITDDVLGHLEVADVHSALTQLGSLPPDAQALAGAILD